MNDQPYELRSTAEDLPSHVRPGECHKVRVGVYKKSDGSQMKSIYMKFKIVAFLCTYMGGFNLPKIKCPDGYLSLKDSFEIFEDSNFGEVVVDIAFCRATAHGQKIELKFEPFRTFVLPSVGPGDDNGCSSSFSKQVVCAPLKLVLEALQSKTLHVEEGADIWERDRNKTKETITCKLYPVDDIGKRFIPSSDIPLEASIGLATCELNIIDADLRDAALVLCKGSENLKISATTGECTMKFRMEVLSSEHQGVKENDPFVITIGQKAGKGEEIMIGWVSTKPIKVITRVNPKPEKDDEITQARKKFKGSIDRTKKGIDSESEEIFPEDAKKFISECLAEISKLTDRLIRHQPLVASSSLSCWHQCGGSGASSSAAGSGSFQTQFQPLLAGAVASTSYQPHHTLVSDGQSYYNPVVGGSQQLGPYYTPQHLVGDQNLSGASQAPLPQFTSSTSHCTLGASSLSATPSFSGCYQSQHWSISAAGTQPSAAYDHPRPFISLGDLSTMHPTAGTTVPTNPPPFTPYQYSNSFSMQAINGSPHGYSASLLPPDHEQPLHLPQSPPSSYDQQELRIDYSFDAAGTVADDADDIYERETVVSDICDFEPDNDYT